MHFRFPLRAQQKLTERFVRLVVYFWPLTKLQIANGQLVPIKWPKNKSSACCNASSTIQRTEQQFLVETEAFFSITAIRSKRNSLRQFQLYPARGGRERATVVNKFNRIPPDPSVRWPHGTTSVCSCRYNCCCNLLPPRRTVVPSPAQLLLSRAKKVFLAAAAGGKKLSCQQLQVLLMFELLLSSQSCCCYCQYCCCCRCCCYCLYSCQCVCLRVCSTWGSHRRWRYAAALVRCSPASSYLISN